MGRQHRIGRRASHDEYQAVIALPEGRVVEVQRRTIDVLYLCDTGLGCSATIDAETTSQVASIE